MFSLFYRPSGLGCVLEGMSQKDITAWVDQILGSNVNDCKNWGTSGVGTQLYNEWARHTVPLNKHSGPPICTAAVKIIVQGTEVGGSKKSVKHIPQAEIYLGLTCGGGHKPDVQPLHVTYGDKTWSGRKDNTSQMATLCNGHYRPVQPL